MAPLNWDRLITIEPQTVAEEIDDWYDEILKVKIEKEENVERLQAIFKLTRTVLEIKATEAEGATEEAMTQVKQLTEANSKREEELNGEIRKLKQQIADLRKQTTSRDRSKDSPAALAEISALKDENGDLKKRIKQFEESELGYIEDRRRSEELEAKMKDMEGKFRELSDERDKFMADVKDYKRQLEMQRETITIKRSEDDDLQKKLRSKNQELLQLLDEVNNLTEANERLQTEKIKLKSSLEDSVAQMEKTTDKFVQLQKALQESDSALESVQRENVELKEQIEELSKTSGSPKKQQRSTLENEILSAVDKKIEEWKTLLESKDNEILSQRRKIQQLQTQINQYSVDSDRVNLMAMKQELDEKSESVRLLKEELRKATVDLDKNTDLMEELRVQLNAGGSITEVQKKRMFDLQQRLKAKEAAAAQAELKAKEAENSAVERDKQLVDLLARMQRYEKGQYGLADAVDEINDLKHQLNIRDRQIEDLTQHCSKCEDKLNELLDETDEMRRQLGLDKRQSFPIKFRMAKREERESDRALNIILQKEVERLEEERLQLKMQMRQLAQRTGQRAVALGLTADEVVAVEEFTEGLKRKDKKSAGGREARKVPTLDQTDTKSAVDAAIVKDLNQEAHQLKTDNVKLNAENARLIQGLKEIQQQMKDSVGRGSGNLESPALDKLLSVISTRDARGVSDSNLTLKADFDQLKGRYEELRSQLKSARDELQRSGVDLISCKKQIQKLQQTVDQHEETKKLQVIHRQIKLPPNTSDEAAHLIHQLNEHLIQELHENSLKEEQLGKLEESVAKYQRKFAVLKHQQGLLYDDFVEEKHQWEWQMNANQSELTDMRQKWSEAQTKLQEFDQLLDNLSTDEIELHQRLAELTRRYTATRITCETLTRQLTAQTELQQHLQEDKDKYEREALTVRNVVMERLAHLQRQKDMSAYQISALQKQLELSCPLSDFESQTAKLLETTEKYRQLLDRESLREIQLKNHQDQLDEQEFLRKENDFLMVELETAKEKIAKLELNSGRFAVATKPGQSETETISKRMATLEMKELNERQKANHSKAMYEQQRDQLLRLERRNAELEQKFDDLTRLNLQLQQIEAKLRDELAQSVPSSVHNENVQRIAQLEKRLAEAKIESDQLKEMAEVTNSQFLYLDKKQREKTVEFEELQRLVLNLQSRSDYTATVGSLHREIIRLKMTETSNEANLRIALSKLQTLRTQLLKSEQRSDDKEKSLQNLRSEMVHKIAQLRKTISSLRSRFAGSVPLQDQEAFAQVLRELKAERQQIHQQLLDISEREKEAQLKVAELSLKQSSLEELLATLKEGSGALKVAEWHNKLEELRLKELRLGRQVERLSDVSKSKDQLIAKLETSITSMELRSVEEIKAWEEREILWESRESELESRFQLMEKQQVWKDREMLRFELPGLMSDGSNAPLTEQLAEALSGLRKYMDMVNRLQQENEVLSQKLTDMQSSAKTFEVEQLKKDQLIKDLKNLIPAETLANLSLSPTETSPIGYDRAEDMRRAKEFLMITVDGLNARLAQKDDAIDGYKQLLGSLESEISQLHKDYSEEISRLKDQLRDKTEEKIARLRQESSDLWQRTAETSQLEKDLLRNVELEELVAERDKSAAAMVDQIRTATEDLKKCRDQISLLEAEIRRLKTAGKVESTGGSKQPSVTTSPKGSKRKSPTKTPSVPESPIVKSWG